jgi:hypothetical protein
VIEQDVRSRRVPLADILCACRDMAKDTQAARLEEWATAELEGYWPFSAVSDYQLGHFVRLPDGLLLTDVR